MQDSTTRVPPPKPYRLKSPDSMHPQWLARFSPGPREGVVDPSGAVLVEGVALDFAKGVPGLPVGSVVRVWISDYFFCELAGDYYRNVQAQQVARQEREEQQAQAAARQRAEDASFNDSLAVPVDWTIGVKDVLSGLSERSDGSGRNRATVNHILLQADLKVGRLARAAGDLLCTSASGTNGKNWSGQRRETAGRVTCARCLALAKTFNRDFADAKDTHGR